MPFPAVSWEERTLGTPHYEVIAAGRKRVTVVAQPSLEPDL